MIPSKIEIESFAKRCHMGTLGGKGLSKNISETRSVLEVRAMQKNTALALSKGIIAATNKSPPCLHPHKKNI